MPPYPGLSARGLANHTWTSLLHGRSWFPACGTFKVAVAGDGDRSLPVTKDNQSKGKNHAPNNRLAEHGSVPSNISFEITYVVAVTVSDPGEYHEPRVRVTERTWVYGFTL